MKIEKGDWVRYIDPDESSVFRWNKLYQVTSVGVDKFGRDALCFEIKGWSTTWFRKDRFQFVKRDGGWPDYL